MSWVGLRDQKGGTYCPAGLGRTAQGTVDLNGVLPRGTLMVEFAARPTREGQTILSYEGHSPWMTGLSLTLNAQGLLVLTQVQGAFRRVYTLPTGIVARAAKVGVTFTWDAPSRTAVFSAELVDTGEFVCIKVDAPLPLSLRDAVRITTDTTQCTMSDRVSFAAIADTVKPHGPMPTLAGKTPIRTPQGDVALSTLKAGNLIVTSDGALAQVRWAGSVTLPARGRFAPERLRAPYHGATRDVVCAPGQRMHMRGSEVEYLFATDTVSVAIGDLTEGVQRPSSPNLQTQTYHQILLDRPASIMTNGVLLECFDARGLVQDSSLRSASILANLPTEILPKQYLSDIPLLRHYETLTLSRLRAA